MSIPRVKDSLALGNDTRDRFAGISHVSGVRNRAVLLIPSDPVPYPVSPVENLFARDKIGVQVAV